jgi:hypothetical protein
MLSGPIELDENALAILELRFSGAGEYVITGCEPSFDP